MKKYVVTIEETLTEGFEIEAMNEQDAVRSAKEKYLKGEIILSNGEVQFKQMSLSNISDGENRWIEF